MAIKPREKISLSGSGIEDPNAFLTSFATSDSVVTTKTTLLLDGIAPDDPGNIVTITPGGTTADVKAGDIIVVGTVREFFSEDETLFVDVETTELVAILDNASTKVFTTRPFKTVTSITIPIQDGASATYEVGIGEEVAAVILIPEGTRRELWDVSLTMAVKPTTSEDFTVTLDAAAGATYDHPLYTADLDTLDVASVNNHFDGGIYLESLDRLFLHFLNTEGEAWASQVTIGV